MDAYIIGGLIGFAIGTVLQRFVFYMASNSVPPSICDCCQWKKENQWRWNEKRSRHKK